jgi:phosphoribosyl-ATP pyrophosphohydrolase/phosphoribosyl-AMP cyclohydrolase
MSTFIPTVDISEGKAVLVQKGKVYKVLGDAISHSNLLSIHHVFQLIDIDAAMGKGSNRELIKKITEKHHCYVGGGIRTKEDAIELLNSSARRVIISTKSDLLKIIPKNRLILAIDIDENFQVLNHGRTRKLDKNFFEFLQENVEFIEIITVTFHHKEGTNSGIPLNQVKEIKNFINSTLKDRTITLICAGGISSIDEIKELIKLDVIPQFGSGFWCNKFSLGEAMIELLNYEKQGKWMKNEKEEVLFPCVIQNKDGMVLGSVYCNAESIKKSIDERKATFYSRDNQKLWLKGETSGYIHTVLAVHLNCDKTSLRFIVDGEKFCHLERRNSCFGDYDPNRGGIKLMQKVIEISKKEENQFSTKMLTEGHKINHKIIEHSEHLAYAKTKNEIIENTSDLLYYSMLYLNKHHVDVAEIENELLKRRYSIMKNDLKCVIGDDEIFTVGLVGSHCDNENAVKFLSQSFNTQILNQSTGRNYKFICENNKLKVVNVKPKDINTLLTNGFIDAIISYEDIILNSSLIVEKLNSNKVEGKNTKIVIACKENISYEDLLSIGKSRKLIIMAEYVKFVIDWVRDKNINAEIVHVQGSSESYLVNDLCDLIVVVCDTGETLRANDLKILDVLAETGMYLFVNPEKKYKLNKLI